ncbi:glucose 1-dehydrogenase [Rhodothalassium salexigens]|uniref:glucose 1-dehydrogenase n=1 Tax=Rhodothalassium salexigens TaxID=1086 RepID=UPI00191472E2|nr:glucose 1-dehydrogenase [Rhodothalassium salexigens]
MTGQTDAIGRLAGKRALITGGAGGIGSATARLFLAHGAAVAVSDIDAAGARRTAADLGGGTVALAHDVTDEAAWTAAVAATVEALGGLDILVNNAGIGTLGGVLETDYADWRRVLAVDLDSVFLGCKYALPALAESGRGAIVNVASVAGLIAQPNMAAYNAAKAGVRHLTKSVALDCARKKNGVRCNAVLPAYLNTQILDGLIPGKSREDMLHRLAALSPAGRVGDAEDAGHAIVYLASDEAAFVNGSDLVVDGGLSAM